MERFLDREGSTKWRRAYILCVNKAQEPAMCLAELAGEAARRSSGAGLRRDYVNRDYFIAQASGERQSGNGPFDLDH